jgi:fucose 4-O-acetylase-like acetyltransferase
MSDTSRARVSWVDHAKGIGIFLVVLGHVLRGLEAGGILGEQSPFHWVGEWIYRFHMPLFFLLSGLFAERRVDRRPGDFLTYSLETIAYPYLLWSTIQTLSQFGLNRYTNGESHLSVLAWVVIAPIQQFWFLYALFLISLLYYAGRSAGLRPLGVLVVAVGLLTSGGWPYSPWWIFNTPAAFGIYYALGAWVGGRRGIERLERVPSWLAVAIAAGGFGLVTAAVGLPLGGVSPLRVVATLGGVAATLGLALLSSRARWLDFVRILGAASLEIYVAHTIASAGIRIGLRSLLHINDPLAHILLGTLGGLATPLALAIVARRSHLEFLFRFPRRTPSRGVAVAVPSLQS